MSQEFVEGWLIVQTLGEGTFGEVLLLQNKITKNCVAVKKFDLKMFSNSLPTVQKEAAIHSRLKHRNIISFIGQRETIDHFYIFLEYASGGELFDRIEPDIGMLQSDAKKYFRDLLAGVEYLHDHGVAHRDLKPENLLLDEHGNLKISDFGLATMFLCDGKRRKLEKSCGSWPYLAPEVLSSLPYQAEPTDIWSCGIILVSMLCGELPWRMPCDEDIGYKLWKITDNANRSPWSKLDTLTLSLVRKILTPTPSKRYKISQIKSHNWLNMPKSNACPAAEPFDSTTTYDFEIHPFSQQTQIDDLLVSTQLLTSQSISTPNDVIQQLTKRMTRFILSSSPEEALANLLKILGDLGYKWKVNTSVLVTITTTDQLLVFKSNLILMNHETLMDFRLSRGCGLEFKRHFVFIKNAMSKIISQV